MMPMLPAPNSVQPIALLDTVMMGFEWLNAGLLICRESGQLLFANDAGARILESADGLALDGAGHVDLCWAGKAASQGSAIAFQVALAAAQTRKSLVLSIPRPSGAPPLTLILRRERSSGTRTEIPDASPILVLIHVPDVLEASSRAGLRELFGLTLTEARLAHLMMQGKTAEDCTGLLGVRRTTVKMHLRNLYGKAGVQRQSELVALFFKSLGNVRCGGRPAYKTEKFPMSAPRLASPMRAAERPAC